MHTRGCPGTRSKLHPPSPLQTIMLSHPLGLGVSTWRVVILWMKDPVERSPWALDVGSGPFRQLISRWGGAAGGGPAPCPLRSTAQSRSPACRSEGLLGTLRDTLGRHVGKGTEVGAGSVWSWIYEADLGGGDESSQKHRVPGPPITWRCVPRRS